MKSLIFIVAFAIGSSFSLKAEESLEERKKRIMRRYAPLKTLIEQTNIEVFDEPEEDELVIESEIMQIEDLEFKREKPGQIINYNIPSPRQERSSANWLLDIDDDSEYDEEEDKDARGEYWSIFGDIDEEPEYKQSRKHIYQPHERELRKDIFGITEDVKSSKSDSSYSGSTFNGTIGDRKESVWEGTSQEAASMQSYYIPFKSVDRNSNIESIQNKMNTSSQKMIGEKNKSISSRYKSSTPNSNESFSRPSVNFRSRIQLNRQDPAASNRDFERLIEQELR